ncbi:MAG TPA: hypothetical protein DCO77_12535 [Nitrospiraceae bacterium]|nr:hypothetical protein [Nitrospiraceae bacterium]
MRKSKLKIFSALLALFAYVLLSSLGAAGSVLCFAQDGHLAVEVAQYCSKQKKDSPSSPVPFFAISGPKDQAEPCTDFPTSYSAAVAKASTQKKDVRNAQAAVFSPPPSLFPDVRTILSSPLCSRSVRPNLELIRTVVLLI